MAKQVFYDDDARRRVLGGAKALYEAVKVTMGPKGRNVVIGKGYGGPTVTHDGVKVAKEMELSEDSDEKLGYKIGAELIKQAASKMNDVAGDGTTTVTVLTYHILNEANRLITAGHNPMELRKGVEQAAAEVLVELDKMAENVNDKKGRIAEVGTISAGDKDIGQLIANIMERVGSKGIVTVEDGQGLQLESEIVEGFSTDRGFVSAYMVTDTNRMEAVYEKPSILLTDKKISSVQELLPVLEAMAQAGKKELVIVADDVEGEALGVLVLNKLKGSFHAVAIKAPSFGDRRKDILQDMAILTGATVVSDEQGTTFDNFDLSMLGSARKVIVTKDQTTIVEGAGAAKDVKDRVAQIHAQVVNASSEYDKEQGEKRAAALEGKVAVIKVGGATETEIEEKKYRVEDAVNATKAALAEGIVPGGGVTLVDLSKGIKTDKNDSIAAGKQILKSALLQPFRQLMINAGLNADEKLPMVLTANKTGWGFDVNSPDELVDLKAVGIVDPARVTKEAVQNAVSIASTSMTMGALITEEPEKETPAAAGGMGGGMGMM
ncbi:MAG TPA: chaperonin GroEL [Candidatus Saccharimonadales bacterium]|nr:chaperonin GroEL [Candidatus Saccharimonadales bacterium]